MGQIGLPYDTSLPIPRQGDDESGALDSALLSLLLPLGAWDGVYFTEIARGGYSEEKFFAFFPGFPAVLRVVGSAVRATMGGAISERPAILVGGLIYNVAAGVAAALLLERLSLSVGRSRKAAARDALFFAAGPLNIFGAALYSENTFAMLTFLGLLLLENAASNASQSKFVGAAGNFVFGSLALACAAACRANGILAFGFILFTAARVFFARGYPLGMLLMGSLASITLSLSVFGPFLAHAWHAHSLYCHKNSSSPPPMWCSHSLTSAPSIYAHVQSVYWDAGIPFRRWTLQHAPALVLSAPVTIVSLFATYKTCRALLTIIAGKWREDLYVFSFWPAAKKLLSSNLVYFIHLVVLISVALIAAHAQIATRLAAAGSPALTWAVSDAWDSGGKTSKFFLLLWCGGYTLFGAALFCNCLNWT
jgi:phosphatidylinositol glycan class V